MGMNSNFVQLQQISLKIKTKTVLNSIDLSLNAGQIVAIIGANGCGKTTLLKILAGLLPPSSGTLEIAGLKYSDPKTAASLRQMLGFAPDYPPVYPYDTVESYLKFIAHLKNIPKQFVQTCVTRCLEMCDLVALRNSYICTLSKGMQQRVNIAQAVIHSPQLLILDEPTNGLDDNQCTKFVKLLESLRDDKVTTIFASHHYTELTKICDFMLRIDSGKIEKIMPPLNIAHEHVNEFISNPA